MRRNRNSKLRALRRESSCAAVKQGACRAATTGKRTLFGGLCAKPTARFCLISLTKRDTFAGYVAIGLSVKLPERRGPLVAAVDLAHAALRLAPPGRCDILRL